MFERASLYRILPFAAYIFFLFAADLLGRFGWSAQELRWLYAVKIAAVVALLLALRKTYVELRAPAAVKPRDWVLALVAGVVVFVLWISLDADWMIVGTPAGFDPGGADGIEWGLVAVRLAGAALVVPVMEELFWRSFLMRWLARQDFLAVEPARVGIYAFVVTAVVFAFEHNQWLAGLVAGAAYNWLYMRSGNLWTAILAHAVTNAALGIWIVATGNWHYW